MLKAGLGEKKVSFANIDCNAEEFREKLLEEFPKLKEGGGFDLLRCNANSRVLEPIASVALQSPRATQECVGRSKVYIHPIQADLDMTAVKTEHLEPDTVSLIIPYNYMELFLMTTILCSCWRNADPATRMFHSLPYESMWQIVLLGKTRV